MKIAIASSDAAVVDFLRRIIASVPQHDVIWTAASGTDAARRCATQPPEVLLMGLSRSGSEMVEATQRIMRASPCGIIIVTTSVERDVPPVFAAMGAGALDVIALPPAKERDGKALAAQILQKVWMAGMLSPATPAAPTLNGVHAGGLALIAIGASAGGPPAIAEVLRDLPPDLPAAIIVVQHIDAQFGASMAHWFSSQTKLPVRLAAHGDRLQPGVVFLAAGEQHVVLSPDRTLALTDEPRNAPYRPSADVLFESIARNWQDTAIGAVLSGMGRDGAAGLLRMRQSGARTIAQDQSTSAVFGMPRAAAELSAATDVLPLPAIGPLIRKLARATPVRRDPRPVAVATRALQPARPGARKEPAPCATIVLLVDDQPIVAAAVRQLIAGEADLEFHYCADPSEAIERANNLAPTVILQDLVMPGIEGLELLRLFRDNPSTAETPIVMLSANDDARAKSASFDAGASDYLVKLPEQVELVARIRYHSSACLGQRRRAETAAALLETQQALAERVEELQTALNERSRYRDELEAANQRLEQESFLDALTGALNRRGLEHQLVIELRRAKRDKAPLFALLIDCDNFKGVNDDFGHDTGDQVLKGVASRVAGAARISDPLARVGGDEFLILLPEAKGQAATALAERVRNAVASVPIETDSGPRSQTVSVGVFEVPEDAVSTTEVLARGTGPLHDSKQAGRNRVSVASSLP